MSTRVDSSRAQSNTGTNSSSRDVSEIEETEEDLSVEQVRKNYKYKPFKQSDLETSIQYLESDVYKQTYRGKPVWFYYRRNFKGHYPPPKTRSNCVFQGKLITSNPCPICRDEYLLLDFRHTKLLQQFINPVTSQLLETSRTGLCQFQHKRLLIEVEKARDIGTIKLFIPFQLYNYEAYYSHLPPDQLDALLYASGQRSQPDAHVSSDDFARLPVNVQDILLSLHTIPHAEDYLIPEELVVIEKPKVPNRYKMEEEHKQRVAQRRKSRTLLLN